MARLAARIGFIQFCLAAAFLAVIARAAQLQLVRGGELRAQVADHRTQARELAARRGTIRDRSGAPLVVTQEQYHLSLAPEQIHDPGATARRVARALGLDARQLERELRSRRSVYRHGPFSALDVQDIRGLDGVHLEPFQRRLRFGGQLALHTLGLISDESGHGISGMESALDSVLTGVPGQAVFLRDISGRRFESPSRLISPPVPGHDVYLTIDARLQEIAERALDDAITQMDASGGDVVFLDPWTGAVLALASREQGGEPSAAVFTTPFEPGSTAKLFTAAALLLHDRVDSTDVVDGEDGRWVVRPARYGAYTINDDHPVEEPMTLAVAIQKSSNIGMAKFAQRLTPEELYRTLRDFGFGTRTAVEYPRESDGRLRRPGTEEWQDGLTLESISRGYSVSVTPLQLAAAYGAIANGGVLYTPSLVSRVVAADGREVYRHAPAPVRRVLPADIAARLRQMLRGAVDTAGTGSMGQVENFELVGKTGTARVAEGGRYVAGRYFSSFASIWPADDPQLVAVVKINDPGRGSIFGGLTAAPLTRTILEEALTSRNRALRMNRLATAAPAAPPADEPVAPAEPLPVVRVSWPPDSTTPAPRSVQVPSVRGRAARAAAAALHAAGLRATLSGAGAVVDATRPAEGTTVAAGSTVTLELRSRR